MSRWTIAYRVATVALLAVICLQLGAWSWVKDTTRSAARSIRMIGVPEEAPAPLKPGQRGGIDALYQESTDAAIADMLRRSAPASSGSR